MSRKRKTMSGFSLGQRRLIADYFAQIGVAWFAAGVIGIFVGSVKTFSQMAGSLLWGLGLSIIFLLLGLFIMREKK